METSFLNNEETQIFFTKQADKNMTVPKTESQSSKANSNTEAFLPHGYENADDISYDEDLKVPFMTRKFNFATPTLASEHKTSLKNRLPDFTLTHKTLVSNKKFLEKSILPADKTMNRFRKARRIAYSEQETSLPDIKPVRRSKSMIYPQRRTGSFAGFNLTQSEGFKMRKISHNEQAGKVRKISNERKISPPASKEKQSWSEDQNGGDLEPVLMETDELECSNDEVFYKQTSKLSKRRVRLTNQTDGQTDIQINKET